MLSMGVDIGAQSAKVALVNSKGKVYSTTSIPTGEHVSPRAFVIELSHVLQSLSAKRLALNVPLEGIGLAVAGEVDHPRGYLRLSPNLRRWENFPLRDVVRKHLKLPVVIENDANAAAWGAFVLEGHRKVKNLIAVTLGTGVGGGLMVEGRLYRGTTGSAGEVGHVVVEPGGRPCGCGNRGCLEAYVGSNYFVKQYGATPVELAALARKGNAKARQAFREMGKRLGRALASLVNVFNPEMIVLCGGVAGAAPFFMPSLKKTILQLAFPTSAKAARTVVSRYGSNLGVLGAALLVYERDKSKG